MADYREQVRRVEFRQVKVPEGHSHPQAAAARSSANRWIDEAIANIGHIPYTWSCSNRDVRNGNDYNREIYWTKDATIDALPSSGPVMTKHAIKLIDVDYYVDMREILRMFLPVFIYTFVPTKVTGTVGDATYHTSDNKVIVQYNGGAKYEHELWDYDSDTISADFWWGTNVFLVEHFIDPTDNSRRIVFLNPSIRIFNPLAHHIPGYRIGRKQLTAHGVNHIRSQRMEDGVPTLWSSISIGNQEVGIDLPLEIVFAAIIRCQLAKDPSISDVERIFRAHNLEKPDIKAAIFIQMFKQNLNFVIKQFRTVTLPKSTILDNHSYQTLKPLITEDGKPSVRQITPPILPTGMAPVRSYNNDTECIRGRITLVRNPNQPVPPFYERCANEFIELLIPSELAGTFFPWSEAQVEEVQNRPTQRALAARSKPFAFLHSFMVKSFQKAEVYGKVDSPRNISTVPTDHKMRYASFIYPLAENIKNQPWYAFGKTPRDVTMRVRELCSDSNYIVPTDFSKFDGTHGIFKDQIRRKLYLRAFGFQFHKELVRLVDAMTDARAITSFGCKYETGNTVLSGAADTSYFNTVMNAVISYIALRVKGMPPVQAFNSLGFYGGDDGLNNKVDAKTLEKVANRLGYAIKACTINASQPVPFLGRVFLDPWSTDASICDVPRRLRTLHLTATPISVPNDYILFRKAESYLITDTNTPLIREWSHAVLRIVGPKVKIDKYEPHIRNNLPYLIDPKNNWTMPVGVEVDYCNSFIASQLEISLDKLLRLKTALTRIQQFDDLSQLTLDADVKVVVPAVVGGNILQP